MAWTEAYFRTKWHFDPPSRLATIDMGRKVGGGAVSALFRGRAGSPSSSVSWTEVYTSVSSGILIHPAVWPQHTWAENWELYPFGGHWYPSSTVWPGQRPTFIPSGILIHPTVWPQYTNVTDIQDRHDRQRSDSELFYKRSPKKLMKGSIFQIKNNDTQRSRTYVVLLLVQ